MTLCIAAVVRACGLDLNQPLEELDLACRKTGNLVSTGCASTTDYYPTLCGHIWVKSFMDNNIIIILFCCLFNVYVYKCSCKFVVVTGYVSILYVHNLVATSRPSLECDRAHIQELRTGN